MVLTKHYLLIGAGFSHNWGGWLSSEVFEYLLGDPEVVPNSALLAVLWKHQASGGFEAALDELERDGVPAGGSDAQALRSAVARMFNAMNSAFMSKSLEFRESVLGAQPVRDFLLRFDAIFSINQDLLLEHCYRGSRDGLVDRTDPRTERSWQLPGMQLAGPSIGAVYPSATGIWVPSGDEALAPDEQPIIKLHGSSNWRSAQGIDLMILGGGKARAIERYPVLKRYAKLFRESLSQPAVRLMVIGYGFRDEHINEAISSAIDRGLKLFVIDPLGADVASITNRVPQTGIGYQLTPLEVALRKSLIGASRRRLSSTFSTDEVERLKLERFFLD